MVEDAVAIVNFDVILFSYLISEFKKKKTTTSSIKYVHEPWQNQIKGSVLVY